MAEIKSFVVKPVLLCLPLTLSLIHLTQLPCLFLSKYRFNLHCGSSYVHVSLFGAHRPKCATSLS